MIVISWNVLSSPFISGIQLKNMTVETNMAAEASATVADIKCVK